MDYDLRALEQYVIEFSDDEGMEELLILKYGERKNLLAGAAALWRFTEFDLDSISPVNFKGKFRFQKTDFRRLCAALGIPDEMRAPNRMRWSGLEGLCILLRRLAYPTRHLDLDDFFGRGKADISLIFNQMLAFLNRRWNRLFKDITEHTRTGHWLMLEKLRAAAISVRAKGPRDRI